MRQKRRDKNEKLWEAFQAKNGLSDDTIKMAKGFGLPLKHIEDRLGRPSFTDEQSISDRIAILHEERELRLADRRADPEASRKRKEANRQRKASKKKKTEANLVPLWAKARRVCDLDAEDIRKAKALGLSPKSLLKNIPHPDEPWKTSVKEWIRNRYEKRLEQDSDGRANIGETRLTNDLEDSNQPTRE